MMLIARKILNDSNLISLDSLIATSFLLVLQPLPTASRSWLPNIGGIQGTLSRKLAIAPGLLVESGVPVKATWIILPATVP